MGFLNTLFSGSKDGNKKDQAVLHLGSAAASALIFSRNPDGSAAPKEFAEISYQGSSRHPGQFVIDASVITESLKLLTAKLPRLASIQDIWVALGPEFLRSITFRAVFEREKPKEKIDEAEFKNLLEKAERASRENIGEQLSRQSSGADPRLVVSRLEEMLIDGYGVADPVGLAGKELEIALFNLYAEQTHIEFLQEVKRLLGARSFFPYFAPYGVCRAYALSQGEAYSGIFINIEETLTSVAVVSKNIFLGIKLFSIGSGMFTRNISANLGLGRQEAEEVKEQYTAGKLSAQVSRKVAMILKRAASVWATGVELALEEFSAAVEPFPSAMLLYGVGADLPDLTRALGEPDRFGKIPFLEKRTPIVLVPAMLPFLKEGNAIAKNFPNASSADVPLFALAHLSSSGGETHDELSRIVQRMTRLAYS